MVSATIATIVNKQISINKIIIICLYMFVTDNTYLVANKLKCLLHVLTIAQ